MIMNKRNFDTRNQHMLSNVFVKIISVGALNIALGYGLEYG